MISHQASEQMIGYIYQVRYALNLLLKNDDEQAEICIEKFDDISFSNEGTPKNLIQLKHHTKQYGDLTDSSTDLWRTLKVWIDNIKQNSELLTSANFTIITTASAPVDSAAYYLKNDINRDVNKAYEILKNISENSINQAHLNYYKVFNEMNKEDAIKFMKQIIIVDKSNNIIDVQNEIKKELRYCCMPTHQEAIYERLEGWWFQKSIEALCSIKPIFFTQRQVRSYIVALSNQYAEDNLPIDIDEVSENELESITLNNQIFYEQLKLIGIKNRRFTIALRDYYRAFMQRANWVRNDLLYVNELEEYEKKLIDEWEHCFCDMQDEIEEYDEITDELKRQSGKRLFTQMEQKDIRIRPKCSDAFVMRGSYHILSNQLKIGWHVDFYERLKALLK